MDPSDFSALALSMPHVNEGRQSGRPEFRIADKIFATLWPLERRAVIKLSPQDQIMRLEAEGDIFYRASGFLGEQGWTNIMLDRITPAQAELALKAAWGCVAPQKLKRAFDI
jgi:hypothetical protein